MRASTMIWQTWFAAALSLPWKLTPRWNLQFWQAVCGCWKTPSQNDTPDKMITLSARRTALPTKAIPFPWSFGDFWKPTIWSTFGFMTFGISMLRSCFRWGSPLRSHKSGWDIPAIRSPWTFTVMCWKKSNRKLPTNWTPLCLNRTQHKKNTWNSNNGIPGIFFVSGRGFYRGFGEGYHFFHWVGVVRKVMFPFTSIFHFQKKLHASLQF